MKLLEKEAQYINNDIIGLVLNDMKLLLPLYALMQFGVVRPKYIFICNNLKSLYPVHRLGVCVHLKLYI